MDTVKFVFLHKEKQMLHLLIISVQHHPVPSTPLHTGILTSPSRGLLGPALSGLSDTPTLCSVLLKSILSSRPTEELVQHRNIHTYILSHASIHPKYFTPFILLYQHLTNPGYNLAR